MSQSNQPSYYAVIFCSQRTDADDAGYAAASERMRVLASQQSGFLGMESVRDDGGFGITVSYWRDLDAVAAWKRQVE
ncbi:MAG: antibiotic biosynthesis monooxygenase family protein, partial [Blastopirellula sp. JB062]